MRYGSVTSNRNRARASMQPAPTLVYKICTRAEWAAAEQAGVYAGSTDDARDGFIHFSAADQVRATAAKYFAGKRDLVLVTFEAARLGTALRWEPSRGGALFPHLYGRLEVGAAQSVRPLPLGPDDLPVLPEDIDRC